MTSEQLERLVCAHILELFKEPWVGTSSQWMERKLHFNEALRAGPFSFRGREYLREPADFFGCPTLRKMVECFGTQTGKTTVIYGGVAYRIWERARRVLYVKPSLKGTAGAENDARTRAIPMFKASECIRDLIPQGANARFIFKTAQQVFLNGSIVDWVGSNSEAQLASNAFSDVIRDEIDKFNAVRKKDSDGNAKEADASELAGDRMGMVSDTKEVAASSPSLEKGPIWQELLETDLRRRFVPCPLCGRDHPSSRRVVIVWSKEYTVLPVKFSDGSDIPLAFVQWDKEARNKDGSWDLERVEKSAGYVCPHCGGRFMDKDKLWMDANGIWIPTKKGVPDTVGYHLPSWYSSHDKTTAGKLAVEFLKAKRSLKGTQNFINSKCAEPKAAQGQVVDRSAMVAANIDTSEKSPEKWFKIITVDYHRNSPYFWAVVRAWNGTDKSHGLAYRSFDSWDELDRIQQEFGVLPVGVGIDCRYMPKEVYRECAAFDSPTRCALEPAAQDQLPLCVGWTPLEGASGRYFWKDKTGLYHPWRIEFHDPFDGTEMAYKCSLEVVKFRSDVFQDMLENVRLHKTGLQWTGAAELYDETYAKHMAGKKLHPDKNTWVESYSHAPDHIRDCEKMQVVMAMRLQLISFEAIQIKKKDEKTTIQAA